MLESQDDLEASDEVSPTVGDQSPQVRRKRKALTEEPSSPSAGKLGEALRAKLTGPDEAAPKRRIRAKGGSVPADNANPAPRANTVAAFHYQWNKMPEKKAEIEKHWKDLCNSGPGKQKRKALFMDEFLAHPDFNSPYFEKILKVGKYSEHGDEGGGSAGTSSSERRARRRPRS